MTSNKTEVITKIIATKMINSNPRIARGESSDINMEKENFINLVKDFIKLNIEEINENYVKIADTLIHDFSIIKDDKNIKVEIYEDEIIKNINYINNENLPSVVSDARQNFIKDIIELVKITRNEKGLLINTQGSYLIEYKDVNKDNVVDWQHFFRQLF